jgi:ketosteroid isomerase-like protein
VCSLRPENIIGEATLLAAMSSSFSTVDNANRRFEELFNAGRLDELAELYSVDAQLLPPDKKTYRGREQIKQFWQGARDAGVDQLRLRTGSVLEAGADRLIETSAYEHTLDRGNFQVIWKRSTDDNNERWLLDIDIFN